MSEIIKSITELTPFIGIIGLAIGVTATILYYKTRIKKGVLIDDYRQDIEYKLYRLEKELLSNRERYEKINHLLIDSQQNSKSSFSRIEQSQNIKLFKDLDIDPDIPINKKMIFVLSPFNEKFDESYKQIREICFEAGFDSRRGDEDMVPNLILRHILKQILSSRLVIANITGRNPNVMYELGICHAIGKPVLLISESEFDIPFDISSTRILIYKNSGELRKKLKNWILHTILETE